MYKDYTKELNKIVKWVKEEDFSGISEEDRAITSKDIKNATINLKEIRKIVKWYQTLTYVLNLGFDLDKNSARDLLGCVNDLLK